MAGRCQGLRGRRQSAGRCRRTARDAGRAPRIGRPARPGRRAGGRRVLVRSPDRPWPRARSNSVIHSPGIGLALADDREAAPPVELPRRSVVAAGRDQGRAARVARIELVEQRARDAAPKRARSHDQPVDVDGPVVEDLPRHGARRGPSSSNVPSQSSPAACNSSSVSVSCGMPSDADQPGLDRVRLALEREHGPGDRLVREVEQDRQDRRSHSRRSRQISSDGQRRAHASSSALR